MNEIPKSYEPKEIESRWYSFWLEKGYFTASTKSKKPKFSIVIPPPNVTGALHMGHALNCTLQDILVRSKRMKGFNALWVPGLDHAGIATQMVVERTLAAEGIKREELGREKFLEKVWEWKEKYGGVILEQKKRLGISVDWTRTKFTLDESLSVAVRKVFVDLYKKKLIYRGKRLVNWCPRCVTAVSDLEVIHQEQRGTLWHIRYSDDIVVATTRPETMLGDVAVAVHPKDARYKKLIGKTVELPLTGRQIPVIADTMVDQSFGSGVVKITPAHDFNDYEVGVRHKLEMISIFDERAVINEHGGKYKGLKAQEARKRVLEDLQDRLVKEEPHTLSVGTCQRCSAVIEPRLSEQWFLKTKGLAKPAAQVVKTGKIKFTPENWKKVYLEWLKNIQDWCISRQLWWGHRIPAWYCDSCNHVTVSMKDPTKCEKCKSTTLRQDPDVLDTWFSSQLWPFSTLGWPEKTKDLQTFYPTDVLVTGFDIIFFWVARMVMAGLYFTKKIPFKTVYINPIIRDERGQKMSKSKGNVVDPLDLVNEYGTDALRFTLTILVGAGRDIKFSEDRLDGYRHFINKIWNSARFSLMALENVTVAKKIDRKKLTLSDLYILESLRILTAKVNANLDKYQFTEAAQALYDFTWYEFCDWYLELSKPVLYGEDLEQKSQSGAVLLGVLDQLLKLMHPFIPFVTEEIYQRLPVHGESLCVEKYPREKDAFTKLGDKKAFEEMEILKSVITAIRNIRGENRVSPAVKLKVRAVTTDKLATQVLQKNMALVMRLANIETFDLSSNEVETRKCAVTLVTHKKLRVQVVVPLEGIVDLGSEISRLQKELEKVDKDLMGVEQRLSLESFVKNAPSHIVKQEQDRKLQLLDKKNQINTSLQRLS